MLCEFQRVIYPPVPSPGSYMVALYHPCEQVKDLAGNVLEQIKAVGYCLPTAENLRFNMQGRWKTNSKFGVQFEVESYDEVLVPTKEGVIGYLASGQIKGIGQKTAEKIYDLFGVKALDVLDSEPEKLLQIKGITEKKLQKIRESYLMNRGARDIIAFLAPHGITPRQALKFYEEYAEHTMDTVKNHPYRLCELSGVGFLTADKIAASMGFDQLSTERVDEGLLYTLTEAEGCGHLCLEKHAFLKAALKLLDTPDLTAQMAANRAARLVESGQLTTYDQYVYRTKTAHAESHLARRVQKSLHTPIEGCTNLEMELNRVEEKLNLRFAPEQRQAVKMALTQVLSVITGGPGTGKTMIQKAILDIYHRQNPDATICCCAPTGRAARRMEQATGHPASTIHKALNLVADEDGNFNDPELLDADLVLVDEVSMLDIYLAGYLLDAISLGEQVVLIGDSDQLPSVGPGAVLSEIIASGKVPVARLDKVFRQQAGSRIAVNAKAIRQGVRNLEFGEDFQFVDSSDIETSADKVVELYLQEVKKFGLDNVALLTPYRKKTATGANALNLRLRDIINPPASGKPEATHGKRVFRLGDRVMQMKNLGEVNNGDVGYITDIFCDTEGITIRVNFGDGREVEYDTDQLSMLDLGYASTVHKSQGSESQSVIVNLQKTHYIMLTRPLVYTAITRGKSRVIMVGEKRALYMAISRTDTEKRGTCLAKRIKNS